MSVAIETTLFSREGSFTFSEALVAMSFCKKNSRLIDDVFFELSSKCMWGIADCSSRYYEIANIQFYRNSPASSELFMQCLNETIKKLLVPDYDEYLDTEKLFYSDLSAEALIERKLLGRDDTTRLTPEQYAEMAENYAAKGAFRPLQYDNIQAKIHFEYKDIDDMGLREGLAFLGLYYRFPTDLGLKHLLSLEAFSKMVGGVANGDLYRKYRDGGLTYAAFSTCSANNNLFCTGLIANNCQTFFHEIEADVRSCRFTEERFESSKALVLFDILFACAEIGERAALLPYSLYCHEALDIATVKTTLDSITIDEANAIFPLPLKKSRIDLKSPARGE